MSGSSQSPTPEENGEKQQQIRSQDEKNVLETETVSVESEIAKVQPFPNNNAIFSCHDLTTSGDRPISPSQPEVEKPETVDSSGELDRVRTISDEKTYPRYTGQISLFSPFLAPLFTSIQRSMRLKAMVWLNSYLSPVQKYLTRLIRAINFNTETVKSYHCCLLPVAFCLPLQVSFRLGARSQLNITGGDS